MKNLCVLILVLIILAMSACTTKVNTEADLAAIREAGRNLMTALSENNAEAIMVGLSADHITMAPNTPTFSDMAKLRAWHEERIAQFKYGVEFSSKEIHIAGVWAIECWTAKPILTPKDGGSPIKDIIKGIWIWRCEETDGTWKLARSIWNSDNPIPTTE